VRESNKYQQRIRIKKLKVKKVCEILQHQIKNLDNFLRIKSFTTQKIICKKIEQIIFYAQKFLYKLSNK
jgi:hypothetical protein